MTYLELCRKLLAAKAAYHEACDQGANDKTLAPLIERTSKARAALHKAYPGFRDSEAYDACEADNAGNTGNTGNADDNELQAWLDDDGIGYIEREDQARRAALAAARVPFERMRFNLRRAAYAKATGQQETS